MADSTDGFSEKKERMWKMKEELLNSLSEKELRAFLKGYMMGERMAFKQMASSCDCGSCQCGSQCKEESCGCGQKNCNCGKE